MRAEEKALISLFEEGGRGEPRPPSLEAKRKPLNRGLALLSFQGDEAFVSFPDPQGSAKPFSFGKAPENSSSKWCGPKLKKEGGSPGLRSAVPGTEFFLAGMRRFSRLALQSPKPRAQRFFLAAPWKGKSSPRAEEH